MKLLKNILYAISIIIIISGATNCAERRHFSEADKILAGLTPDQKIGQMIMPAIPGRIMNQAAYKLIRKYQPGGVVLFGYNLSTAKKTKKFIRELQKSAMKNTGIPLFISIDQEGGRVKRITDGVTQFPGNCAAGAADDPGLVRTWASSLGKELRLMGVNMNLAPVLDVNNNPKNPVINIRSFGSDPERVARLGAAYITGLQESHCIAVGKHFPGHGDTSSDSHYTLPVIHSSLARLRRVEFVPFKEAIADGLDAIMTAHIAYPDILGSGTPATDSPGFLTSILRKELGFRGLVITDDMEMHAISKRQEIGAASVRSIRAGADIVLLSSYGRDVGVIIQAIKQAVREKKILMSRIDASVRRILEVKIRYRIMEYKNGAITTAGISYPVDNRDLSSEAEKINREISRRAIYYQGTSPLPRAAAPGKKILVTHNSLLRSLAQKKTGFTVYADTAAARNDIRHLSHSQRKKAVLYLHVIKLKGRALQETARFCKGRGIRLVVLSSGNPFPIAASPSVDSALYSFSDTEESIRALWLGMIGALTPKTSIPIHLGPGPPGQ